jgi:hypothetical protein
MHSEKICPEICGSWPSELGPLDAGRLDARGDSSLLRHAVDGRPLKGLGIDLRGCGAFGRTAAVVAAAWLLAAALCRSVPGRIPQILGMERRLLGRDGAGVNSTPSLGSKRARERKGSSGGRVGWPADVPAPPSSAGERDDSEDVPPRLGVPLSEGEEGGTSSGGTRDARLDRRSMSVPRPPGRDELSAETIERRGRSCSATTADIIDSRPRQVLARSRTERTSSSATFHPPIRTPTSSSASSALCTRRESHAARSDAVGERGRW